jgi:hypothetical protein
VQGWGTLLLAQAGISLNLLLSAGGRPPPVTLLLLLGSGATLALAGAWLTVNFRFVQMQHPAVVLAFERLLLTGLLPVAAGMQTLGLSAMAQPSELPYYLAALLCGLYQLFGRPLSSSFHATKSGRAIGGGGGGGSSIAAEAVVQVRPAHSTQHTAHGGYAGRARGALLAVHPQHVRMGVWVGVCRHVEVTVPLYTPYHTCTTCL